MSKYKGLYYVGVKVHYPLYHCDIFRCTSMPTRESHGDKYAFCFGGYKLKRKAIQVAMYQNYHIDN